MNGPAKVIIDNSRGEYVLLESQAVVRGKMTTAGVKAVQSVVMPEDLLLGKWEPKVRQVAKRRLDSSKLR